MIVPLLAAAALAAGPVPLLDAPQAQSLAVAGGEVVVARAAHGGRVRVDAVAVEGGAVRHLLATRRLGARWTARSLVAASPQRVAVAVNLEKFVDHGPDVIRWRLYTGPASGRLHLVKSAGGRNAAKKWLPVDVAVDGDRVLVPEVRLVPGGSRLRLLTPGAPSRLLPWARNRVLFTFAFAGQHVAYVRGLSRVIVADLESGAQQVSIRADEPDIDVAADGTVVADSFGAGLVTAAPGRSRTVLPGSDHLARPKFAGTRIAAVESTVEQTERPVVLDPAGPRPVGMPTFDIEALDADDRGMAWMANGCVLYASVDAATPTEPPAGPCPRVEVDFEDLDQTLHGRRLHVAVTCVAAPATGCRGTVIMHLHGVAGRGSFHVDAGEEGVATVRLTRCS